MRHVQHVAFLIDTGISEASTRRAAQDFDKGVSSGQGDSEKFPSRSLGGKSPKHRRKR
jgi:hypothetical protein